MASERIPLPHVGGLSPRATLIALNVVGGLAVLASYAWGTFVHPEAMGALWGGVPESLRPLYTVNMLLAAAGYFLFTPYIVFRLRPEAARIGARHGYGLFHGLYLLVLLPSALWLPLTVAMVASPSLALWWTIRLVLAAVGVGSLGLVAALVALREAPPGRVRALVGLVPFCVQTAVLDALVWPAWFPVPPA
jgi:hypothetical protein